MENSQPLSTESFSYGWLTDRKPSSSDETSANNLRQTFSFHKEHNFNFDVHHSTSPTLVHADEIFSDGKIMPVYESRPPMNSETLKASTSVPSSPLFPRTSYKDNNIGKWRKSYSKVLRKVFGFVKPLRKTIGFSMKSNRVDDLERKVCEVRSCDNSLEASPRPSSAYSVVEWSDFKKTGVFHGLKLKKVKSCSNTPKASPCVSPSHYSGAWCDVEGSIHEAILYCKRSIENREDV